MDFFCPSPNSTYLLRDLSCLGDGEEVFVLEDIQEYRGEVQAARES
jgi:hypothetical protein